MTFPELPRWTPEDVRERYGDLRSNLNRSSVCQNSDKQTPEALRTRLDALVGVAALLDQLQPEGLEEGERLRQAAEAIDAELRVKLFELGFSAYRPDAPTHEIPGRWGGYLFNTRLEAALNAQRDLKTFVSETLPAARKAVEAEITSLRQRLARIRIEAART